MKTYFITRFSILDVKSDSWVISRQNKDFDILKQKLFSLERLTEKMWTLKNITYKSLVSQTNQDYIWLIYISNQLPEKFKNEILSIGNEKIKIIEVEDQKDFFRKLKETNFGENYSTVRLDDDDGLNPYFIEIINDYYTKKSDIKIISFPKGIKIKKENNILYAEKKEFYYKKIAIGLTMFDDNIYFAGNHVTIDEKYQVFYDEKPDMYLIYSSNICDTQRKFNDKESFKFDIEDYLKKNVKYEN